MYRVHGDKIIKRRTNYRKENDIQKYTKILKEDFGNMCGYCGKDFNIIKLEIEKSIKDASIILIDKENIENLQNIKFEALIINSEINLDNKSIVFLQKICKNLKYLIVNTDKNTYVNILNNDRICIITYGLNHKCTVTASSIKEENIMIALQREIIDRYGHLMIIGEKRVKPIENLDIYGTMTIFIIKLLYLKNMQI